MERAFQSCRDTDQYVAFECLVLCIHLIMVMGMQACSTVYHHQCRYVADIMWRPSMSYMLHSTFALVTMTAFISGCNYVTLVVVVFAIVAIHLLGTAFCKGMERYMLPWTML
jgi:hypothetical protein